MNDTIERRQTCVQAKQKFMSGKRALNKAEPEYANLMTLEQLEKSPIHVTDRIRFPDSNNQVTKHYQQACETAGGVFRSSSGLIDCSTPTTTTTTLLVDNGECLPPGPECEHYAEHPLELHLDGYQHLVSYTHGGKGHCTTRGIDQVDTLLSASEMSLPKGEPQFININATSTTYNDTKRQVCLVAMEEMMVANEPLAQAHRERTMKDRRIDLLQLEPLLIQREWYDNDMDKYQQLCEQQQHPNFQGARFQSFTGVLDCVSLLQGANEKTTLVVQQGVTCFPPRGCEGYDTLEDYRMDTLRHMGQSCTVRAVVEEEQVEASSQQQQSEMDGILIVMIMTVVLTVVGLQLLCGIVYEYRYTHCWSKRKGWENRNYPTTQGGKALDNNNNSNNGMDLSGKTYSDYEYDASETENEDLELPDIT